MQTNNLLGNSYKANFCIITPPHFPLFSYHSSASPGNPKFFKHINNKSFYAITNDIVHLEKVYMIAKYIMLVISEYSIIYVHCKLAFACPHQVTIVCIVSSNVDNYEGTYNTA